MKKRIYKSMIGILTSVSMVFGVVGGFATNRVEASDVWDPWEDVQEELSSPAYPTTDVTFHSITSIKQIIEHPTTFDLKVEVNNTEERWLHLQFPEDGGFQLHTGKTAYFQPENYLTIQYDEVSDSKIVMSGQGGDGTKVIYQREGNDFLLEIYNREGQCVVPVSSQNIQFGYNSENGYMRARLTLPLHAKEAIYGSGERFNGLNQVGKRLKMWNYDAGYIVSLEEYMSKLENAEYWRGYKNIPILHSSQGYTVFANTFYAGTADIGYTDENVYTLDFEEYDFNFFFWTGTAKENLEDYTELTGKSILLPKWAYEYSAGANHQVWNAYDADKMLTKSQEVITKYTELGTPNLAAVYLEGIEESYTEVYKLFEDAGIRALRWNSANMEPTEMQQYLPETSTDQLPEVKSGETDDNYGNFIDFTKDNSKDLLVASLRNQCAMGMRGGLLDFGELIGAYAYFPGQNRFWQEMHNFYPYWYARRYSEAMEELNTSTDGYVFFSRAACAGTQAYTAFFTGDQMANMTGLKNQLTAGLSASASGLTMWGGDLAGYEGTPSQDTFARGMQFATFQPIMRSHGITSRFPWDYGTLGEETYKTSYWLRENLLNKIYSEAVIAHQTGQAMTEPLTMAYEDDDSLRDVYSTYLFCQDFLVAPALEENVYLYDVTFPTGSWYSLWDGTQVSGGGVKRVEAPADKSPVYVKAGAVIPVTLAPSLKLTDSMQDQEKTEALMVTLPDSDRETTYWKDENTSVSYTNCVVDRSTFQITAGNGNDAKVILLKGSAVSKVVVDGSELTRFTSRPTADSGAGYFCEDNSETIICLGTNDWSNVQITAGKMDVPNVMLEASASDIAKKAIDGDYDTAATGDVTYDLGQVRTLKNLVVKWTRNCANTYKVETSTDNSNWTTIANETDAYGAISDYGLDGKQVRYVRISNISSTSGETPELYEVEAYEKVETVVVRPVWTVGEDFEGFASYYSDYIETGKDNAEDLKLASADEYWTIDNGTITRKPTEGDVQDDYCMAELFVKDKKYTDFELNVDVSVGSNGWWRAFVGFGAKMGRHIQQSGGGNMVFLEADNVRYGGWMDNRYEEGIDGIAHDLSEKYYEHQPIHLRLVVENKKATVYVGNSDDGTTFNLADDYDGGYIYLASNSTGASYSNLRIEEIGGINLYGHSLTLGGDIGVNYYLQLSDEVKTDADAYVQMSIPGGATTVTKVCDAVTTVDGNDMYKFTYHVAAKEMTDVITAEFYSGDGELLRTFQYSVSDYTNYVVKNSGKFSSELVNLANAMMNYGGCAQTLFDYHTDSLASEGVSGTVGGGTINASKAKVEKSEGFNGLDYYGSSLVLEANTDLNLFFRRELGRDISDYQVSITDANGTKTEGTFVLRGNLYCVTVQDIPAHELGSEYEVTVTCGSETMTVTCTAQNYVSVVLDDSSSDEKLKNLVEALYWYGDTAKSYQMSIQ